MLRWEVLGDVDALKDALGLGFDAFVELVVLALVVAAAPVVEMAVHTALDFDLDQHR